MKALVLALTILACGPSWGVVPRSVVVAAQNDEARNHLDWVVDLNGNGHFEACDSLSCRPLTGNLSSEEASRFFGFYQDTLAQISQQELRPAKGMTNPLTGASPLKQFGKIILVVNGLMLPGAWASHRFNNPKIYLASAIAALAATIVLTVRDKKHYREDGRKASSLLRLARQLEETPQAETILLAAEDYGYLLQTLEQAYGLFGAFTHPQQASRSN